MSPPLQLTLTENAGEEHWRWQLSDAGEAARESAAEAVPAFPPGPPTATWLSPRFGGWWSWSKKRRMP